MEFGKKEIFQYLFSADEMKQIYEWESINDFSLIDFLKAETGWSCSIEWYGYHLYVRIDDTTTNNGKDVFDIIDSHILRLIL